MARRTTLQLQTSGRRDQAGFASTSGIECLVMVATVAVYFDLTLPLAARLFSPSRFALAAVTVPVGLIYAGAFIAAIFSPSKWSMNERLSSRGTYFGNVAFVLITWGCGAPALVFALCFRLYHWISAM